MDGLKLVKHKRNTFIEIDTDIIETGRKLKVKGMRVMTVGKGGENGVKFDNGKNVYRFLYYKIRNLTE